MRTYLECVPCVVRQALDVSRSVTNDAAVHERVIRETLRLVADMPFDRPPPWMGAQIHRLLREASGHADPYAEAKERSNALALGLYPALKQRIGESADPFATAVRLAIAGNVIDFACRSHLSDDEVHEAIEDAMECPVGQGAIDNLRRAVDGARDILYLADNAGEIVFDRLLIEELPTDRITLVVRGSPVINDATLADAELAGLTSLVPVIDNGSDVPGTILEECSSSFRARFGEADLIIAKGQGNYETLSGVSPEVFFLLKVKCPVIGRDIGCAVGEIVVRRDPAEPGLAERAGPATGLEKPGLLRN